MKSVPLTSAAPLLCRAARGAFGTFAQPAPLRFVVLAHRAQPDIPKTHWVVMVLQFDVDLGRVRLVGAVLTVRCAAQVFALVMEDDSVLNHGDVGLLHQL